MSVVRVAAGVLRRSDGAVLITQRPAGKIAAGRWEFPGGKIETGEAVRCALERELDEEIGVQVSAARPLIRLRHAYSERTVELDTWLVDAWRGEPRGLEGQALAWVRPERIRDYDVLEADGPIVDALRLPSRMPVTGAFADQAELANRCQRLAEAGHRLIRLRIPALDDASYGACAVALAAVLQQRRAGLVIDRPSLDMTAPGIVGLQLRGADLHRVSEIALPDNHWLLASCHDAADIAKAESLGVHALVLGPVAATATHPAIDGMGWPAFAALADRANRPVYAIGGLHEDDVARAQEHGAQGIAAIGAYW